MPLRRSTVLAVACLAVFSAPAILVGQQPPQVFSFDLDVPGGNYSEWALETPSGIAGVSATIVFETLRPKSQWMPSFALMAGDPEGSVSVSFAQRVKNGPLIARLRRFSHGELTDSKEFPGSYSPGDTVTFTLSWSSEGDAIATFEGVTLTGIHISPPQRVSIAVSSGQVKASRLSYLPRD